MHARCMPMTPMLQQLVLCSIALTLCQEHTTDARVIPSEFSKSRGDFKQPVIFDTDFGSFADDPVAIALALSQPTLDVKLVVTCSDDTEARARIAAKFLTLCGRGDVPIGVGLKTNNDTPHFLWPWGNEYNLDQYSGKVYENGIDAMARIIQSSPVRVIIFAIGPMTNFPTLLHMYPDVVNNADVVAMGGSIYSGYLNSSEPAAEYNVKWCPGCFNQTIFAQWNIKLVPTDSSRQVIFNKEQMKQLLSSLDKDALAVGSLLAYFCLDKKPRSSYCNWTSEYLAMFDAATISQALSAKQAEKWIETSVMHILVTPEGYTVINNKEGAEVYVALYWHEPNGLSDYEQFIADSLCLA